MKRLAVVAFGGNALLKANEEGTIAQQERNARYTSERLLLLLKNNYNLVITHGNGPQVGNILLANNAGLRHYDLPEMPLDIAVAYSQGFIGYIIEQQLRNVLRASEMDRDIISIITQVLVTKDDPAFKHPSKPIGPYYTKEEADKIATDTGSKFAEDPQGRGYRKVVASPKPLVISNVDTIRKISREARS